jgi:hypothetical protein
VDSSTADTVQITNYVEQLFPRTESKEANVAAALYADVGKPIDQAIGIMGECEWFSP